MVLWQDLDEIHATNLSEILLGIECSDLDSQNLSWKTEGVHVLRDKKVSDMISDDQIMKTQTCFLQEMVQKERIQPSTVDLVHLVPFCLSLVTSEPNIGVTGDQ